MEKPLHGLRIVDLVLNQYCRKVQLSEHFKRPQCQTVEVFGADIAHTWTERCDHHTKRFVFTF